jgi:N-acyl homoserine lactone hydrolase
MTSGEGLWEVLPFDAGSFSFADDEPWPGEEGVVVAHALRDGRGNVFLFDTGINTGDPELDARYHPVARPLEVALAGVGIDLAMVRAATNCHLHADHAGQNAALAGIPIYVQRPERLAASRPGYTVAAWIDGPGVTYSVIDGDRDVAPGIRILTTPGHSPGHQSLLVDTRGGRVLLAGQAIYSREEWLDRPGREGRSRAADQPAYDRSVARLRGLAPGEVRFAHDRATWQAGQ